MLCGQRPLAKLSPYYTRADTGHSLVQEHTRELHEFVPVEEPDFSPAKPQAIDGGFSRGNRG